MSSPRIYLDSETVGPTDDDEIRSLVAGLSPPGNYTDQDAIDRWYGREGAKLAAKGGLQPEIGRILVIVAAIDEGNPVVFDCDKDEAAGLRKFCQAIHKFVRKPEHATSKYVAFNAPFDLGWIWKRCMVHRIPTPQGWPTPLDYKPWSTDYIDPMTMWAGREKISADKLYKTLGIEVPEGEINGAGVRDAYLAGQMPKIIEHCVNDVTRLRELTKILMGERNEDR